MNEDRLQLIKPRDDDEHNSARHSWIQTFYRAYQVAHANAISRRQPSQCTLVLFLHTWKFDFRRSRLHRLRKKVLSVLHEL